MRCEVGGSSNTPSCFRPHKLELSNGGVCHYEWVKLLLLLSKARTLLHPYIPNCKAALLSVSWTKTPETHHFVLPVQRSMQRKEGKIKDTLICC